MSKSEDPAGFQKRATIIIAAFRGARLDVDPAAFGWPAKPKPERGTHHLIIGEFLYCGLCVDGEMVVHEKHFNTLVEDLGLRMTLVHSDGVYFAPLPQYKLRKLHAYQLTAHCVGDNQVESDDDENFAFHLLSMKAR